LENSCCPDQVDPQTLEIKQYTNSHALSASSFRLTLIGIFPPGNILATVSKFQKKTVSIGSLRGMSCISYFFSLVPRLVVNRPRITPVKERELPDSAP
jgi:hypothetical protein